MTHRPRHRPGLSTGTVLAVLAALAVGAAGGYFFPRPDPNARPTKSGDATGTRPDRITALGRLQPTGGVVPVVAPPGDRILRFHGEFTPGMKLTKGQDIADLESLATRNQELIVAESQLREAEAAKAAATTAGQKRIVAAQAEIDQAEANKDNDLKALKTKADFLEFAVTIAEKQLDRAKGLKAKGVEIADENIEKGELQVRQAMAERDGTVAVLTKTETSYAATIKAAKAKLDAARADLDAELAKVPTASGAEKIKLAGEMKKLAQVKAPIDGTVLKVTGRVGQPTGLDPILQMADLTKMTAVAEVYESDIRHLKEWTAGGKQVKATIRNPALGDVELSGTASAADISGMIARNTVFAMGPREDADRRVIEVVVHLAEKDVQVAAGLVGLQVTVELAK